MTRITFGQLRMAVMSAGFRATVAPPFNFPVYPTASLQKAVRTYHFGQGPAAALRDLDAILSRSWSDNASKRGKARTARQQFANYLLMDANDGRIGFAPVEIDVDIGDHVIGTRIDVALLENDGYSARVVLWTGPQAPPPSAARLLACAAVLGLGAEMGDDRVVAAEIWHPRTLAIVAFGATEARNVLTELEAVVQRALS